jgi:7-cyano-7-deazaguanine reductase
MKKKGLRALGKKVTTFKGFDTFPTPPSVVKVTCTSDEVTAVCPVTGQPDWYTVEIRYMPDEVCLESKSLKLYLHSFRNEGLFCEDLSRRIAEDIFKALEPQMVEVVVTQKPRGGISIVSFARKERE